MSQEYSSSKRSRRTTRSQRNKPVLVTPSNTPVEDENTTVGTAIIEEPKQAVVPTVPTIEPVEKPARKLPSFFSSVKKSEPETVSKEEKEAEIVQARLARATHGKATTETVSTKSVKVPDVESKSTTPTTTSTAKAAPKKPTGPFKTRHIIGLAVYIIAADFLGLFEQKILQGLGLEKQLGQFNLFGGTLHVQTSTIAFLASLVIILVLLARFDLIPTSLGGSGSRRTPQSTTRNSNTTPGERTVQPTIRQGVKGSDDTLYQQYRDGQRRQKKK